MEDQSPEQQAICESESHVVSLMLNLRLRISLRFSTAVLKVYHPADRFEKYLSPLLPYRDGWIQERCRLRGHWHPTAR